MGLQGRMERLGSYYSRCPFYYKTLTELVRKEIISGILGGGITPLIVV